MIPTSSKYCIIGAGIHGLSTAWHLARELKARESGSGSDIVVIDKTGIAAGASGIACGVIRNYYLQPAMGELMVDSVRVWEENAEAFHYHKVGYIALASDIQAKDFETIVARHETTGYQARLIQGEQKVFEYMRELFPDWQARGLSVCLHELQGGFAFNKESIQGLAEKARSEGVQILSPVSVTDFDLNESDGTVRSVKTDQGEIKIDQVVVAAGPWVKQLWQQLELPEKVDVNAQDGLRKNLEMWTYWQLQEGEIEMDPLQYATAHGKMPPVIHVDSVEPLMSIRSGKQITDEMWGIYFKRDRAGVQGGAVPLNLGHEAQVDPYGTESPYYTADDYFAEYWTSGLAHCMQRFEGASDLYRQVPSGGIGCFTVDSFPIFDWMRPNVYIIADSNHGYKMIGVGKEVARSLMGEESRILYPFRFSRFVEGDLHPTSNGPFPWT